MADFNFSNKERAAFISALENRLKNFAGEHSYCLDNLTSNGRKRVEILRDIQRKHDELEAKLLEERALLEDKYKKLYQPLYAKRFEVVNGVAEVEGTPDETTADKEEDKADKEKGVPEFWLTAMKNNYDLCEEITERDEGALKYLNDIKWSRIKERKGFKLEFFFDTNPYFKNSVLTKIYHMIDDDELIVEKAIGTEIEWYPRMCITEPVAKLKDYDSFFNFFNLRQVEDDEVLDEDSADEVELQLRMEQDYGIGSRIRDKIIPNAVSWFTGEAMTRLLITK